MAAAIRDSAPWPSALLSCSQIPKTGPRCAPPTGPKFTDLPIPAHASPDQIASVVASALSTAGHAGETILLAIPSSWCLAASIAIGDLPRHDRQAMLYRLEEKLPLAAEGIVADFIRHQGNAMGVCAKISVLAPLIEAAGNEQIPVQSVTPAALLAAQALESPNDSPRVLLCGQADGQIDSHSATAQRP